MILTKTLKISSKTNTKKYYLDLGYKDQDGIFVIDIKDLKETSNLKIDVRCDICGNEKQVPYRRYLENKNNGGYYACSRKCATKKANNTCLEKYGVENISQLDSIKEKKIETCYENHGVLHPQQSEQIFLKSKETKFEKYGDENYNNPQKNTESKKEYFLKKYSPYGIINSTDDICIGKCDNNQNHIYEISKTQLYNRLSHNKILCTVCNDIYHSSEELEVLNYIKSIYKKEILESNRKILNGKELDIYLPDKKLAFEYNGLYYHNELYRENDYHLNKTEKCLEKNIQLIHIYTDDWVYKSNIVKSRINNLLGLIKEKVYARKCEIKIITDTPLIRKFLDENHIQGYVNSKINIGLYYNDELISLMTFGNKRKALGQTGTDKDFELLRFCNKLNTSVVGGASRLFKYFIKNYDYNEIISYADRSWSNGKIYETLGFDFVSKTQPNYYYVNRDKRENRFKYRKDVLVKEGYDPNMSEHEIMLSRKIYRIYNSGNLKYIYRKE